KRESSHFPKLKPWTPAFAGVTVVLLPYGSTITPFEFQVCAASRRRLGRLKGEVNFLGRQRQVQYAQAGRGVERVGYGRRGGDNAVLAYLFRGERAGAGRVL